MRVGVAEARKRFAELLDRAMRGETVEIARRDEVVAVIGPPQEVSAEPLPTALERWRREWDVAGLARRRSLRRDPRDRSEGRPSPW